MKSVRALDWHPLKIVSVSKDLKARIFFYIRQRPLLSILEVTFLRILVHLGLTDFDFMTPIFYQKMSVHRFCIVCDEIALIPSSEVHY